MRFVFLALAVIGALMTAPAMAEEKEIAVLKAVLAEGPVDVSLFSAEFLKAVPAPQLEAAAAGIKKTIGPVVAVSHVSGASYMVETATHEMSSDIVLDANGLIVGLFFRSPVAKNQSIEEIVAELQAVASRTSFLVTENGVARESHEPDLALAVGSAFKLGVLKALRAEIDAGTHRWDEVAELMAGDVSLPSGITQAWPVGSPMTLQTLASLMISISDNTATDALMRIVGRDAVEAALGTAPALTTRELFTLKANRELMTRYQQGDLAAKRAVLAELATKPLPDGSKALSPLDAGAEWYLTPKALCALMEAVADLDVMRINPGVANKADWTSIAFKGGSESGVLNLTTLAVAKDGTRYCVAATWNDSKPIDEAKATSAYASLLNKLSKE